MPLLPDGTWTPDGPPDPYGDWAQGQGFGPPPDPSMGGGGMPPGPSPPQEAPSTLGTPDPGAWGALQASLAPSPMQHPGFGDRFARALAEGGIPHANPYARGGDAFAQALLTHAMAGFAGGRMRGMQEAEQKRTEARKAAQTLASTRWQAEQNRKSAELTMQARIAEAKAAKLTLPEIRAKSQAEAEGTAAGKPEPNLNEIRARAQAQAEGTAAGAVDESLKLSPEGRAWVTRGVQAGVPIAQLLPGFGKAAAGQRAAIINEVGRIDPAFDVAMTRAGYGADKASLQKAQTVLDGMNSFTRGVVLNMTPLEDYLKRIPDLGNIPMNAVFRSGALALGSKDMAAFNVFQRSVSTDASKIIMNANIYNELGEQSRKALESLKDGTLTVAGTREALQALRTEFDNRATGQQQTIDTINERIKQRGAPADTSGGGRHFDWNPTTKRMTPRKS